MPGGELEKSMRNRRLVCRAIRSWQAADLAKVAPVPGTHNVSLEIISPARGVSLAAAQHQNLQTRHHREIFEDDSCRVFSRPKRVAGRPDYHSGRFRVPCWFSTEPNAARFQ